MRIGKIHVFTRGSRRHILQERERCLLCSDFFAFKPHSGFFLSQQYIFFYDPAGLPISFYGKGKSSLFFSDPSNLAEWEKYSYSATLDSDPGQEEDQVSPDVRYKLHWNGESQEDDPGTWEQTLLLFLFLHYSDQFQDKPFYDFWARRMIASHMDQILLCSQQAVKRGVQAVIDTMLEEHCKRGKNQRRLKLSLPIILGAISSVVSSSTNSQFRRECLQSLQVTIVCDGFFRILL
ncbi:type 2 DNA topoisomerase 6 subunit B-like [Macrochelys suwanniensis]